MTAGGPGGDARGDLERLGRLSPAKRALLEQRLRAREQARAAEAAAGPPVLSFAQERLWLLAELTPGLSAYNTTRVVRVEHGATGGVDETRLRSALTAVLARHQVLRTHVSPDAAGHPHARVGDPRPALLDVVDRPDDDAALEAVSEFAGRPFDLENDDLVRALLVRVPDGPDVLAVSLHHIASDEASRKVVWDDLSAAYAGAPLQPLGFQYSDFARLQRDEFERPPMREQIDWWRQHLQGAPQVIDLPVDHQRPAVQSYRGARYRVPLDLAVADRLRAFGAARGATLFMTVLAGFDWMVRQWAGTDDVVVGMPVSGRDRHEAEGLIGLFVNTVVVRADCGGAPSFGALVDRVRAAVLDALAHQTVPFDKVVEAGAPTRDVSRNPVFQILVNAITSEHEQEFALGELTARVVDFDPHTTKFDLGMLVAERGSAVDLVFEYSSDLFDETTVADLADEVHTLLRNAIDRPDTPLTEVSALPPRQYRRLVHDVNATDGPFPDVCLHDLISAQAARTPDAVAVADEAGELTYREFDERTNALAHVLVSLGVGPDVQVAVGVRRSVAMETAVIAVLKAGGAYVPLDSDYPTDRLAYMLADCAAPVLITERAVAPGLPAHPRTLFMDDLDELVRGRPTTAPLTGVTPDNLAYTIYTSGSTGNPKGVQLQHRGVVNRLDWMQRTFRLTEADTVLQKTPLSFDVSVWEVLWPLQVGARLYLARPNGHRDVAYLHDVIAREHVTVLHFVPSMLATFLDAPGTAEAGSGIRAVICSGEALPYDAKERFFATLPGAELHNLYGPTEASIDVTWAPCLPGPEHRVLIGAPISNVQVYVVDDLGQPVPVGVPGELYLAGVQLARGYAGRPDLTAERFVDFPLAPDGRAYRTGDVVRWTSDGRIDYLGRSDGQVKLRGFRIELGEIETVLSSSPLVGQSAVLLSPAPSGDPLLAAYVVLAENAEPRRVPTVQVDEWNAVWEQTYDRPLGVDPFFDTSGWLSSFTGEPIPAEEMAEWVDTTVDRIRSLGGSSVLEVGSGSGLLLWRLAPKVGRYVATDFTRSVTDRLARLAAEAELPALEVHRLAADEVDAHTVGTGFDTVVVNSVIQYFPSAAYLRTVLQHARDVLAPGGRIFVGDVRDLRSHEAFAVRAEATTAATSAGELALRAHDRRVQDAELLVHPAFFTTLPSVGHVQIQPKRGAARNEMTCFRYDVVLHGDGTTPAVVDEWIRWPGKDGLSALAARLATGADLGVHGIPDARVVGDLAAVAALADGRLPAPVDADAEADAVEPDALAELAERCGYRLELSVARGPGLLDAAFTHADVPVAFPAPHHVDGAETTNDPEAARRLTELRNDAVNDLLGLLRGRLPDYMVPSAVRVLPWLPLTPNGKLDRKALPAPIERQALGGARVAPRTDTERRLAELWGELLGLSVVGVEDNFFRLGGHSLLAVRLVAAVARTLDVTLALRAVFETPTVAALAAEIDRRRDEDLGGGPEPVDRSGRRVALREVGSDAGTGVGESELTAALSDTAPPHPDADATAFPLSWAQERMWFLDQLESGRPIYTVRRAYRLRGAVDELLLQQVLDTLANRHDSLRTTVVTHGGMPAALVADTGSWPLVVTDVSAADDPRHAARDAIRIQGETPFDLTAGPLATAWLYRLGPDDTVLILRLHHIVVDGWSVDVLVDELAQLYAADGDPTVLPEPGLQYPDFAVWQRRVLDEAALAGQLDYWKRRLEGAPATLELPTDHPHRPTAASTGRRRSVDIGTALTEAVRTTARDTGTTPFGVLYAATTVLLGRLSGQDDVVLGTAIAGRQRPEVARSVGLFANTLVLRSSLSGDPTFRDVLARCLETISGAQANQDVPFERLVEELRPERELGRNPLFQVMINLQPPPHSGALFGDVTISPYEVDAAFARFDLALSFVEAVDGLRVTLEYRAELFEAATVDALLERFLTLLRAACAAPTTPVAELPLLVAGEERFVLEHGTNLGPRPQQTALDLIRRHVEATPDRVAVGGAAPLTYGELWRRSGLLAARLRERTAAGSLVGIEVGRHPGLIVAALATWRAGCAYVPIDTGYPADRVAFMIEDSGAAVVLRDEDVEAIAADGTADDAPDLATPDGLAYVIYTSGSTGRPKGVAIQHRALANLLTSMTAEPGFTVDDTLLAVTTFSFDIAGLELYLPLVNGATVVVADRDTASDPGALAAALRDTGATVVQATPSTYRMLIDDGWGGDPGLTVLCGGEALPAELAAALLPRVGELWNCYGPTETTIWSTVERVTDAGDITIGRPIANTTAYVLDAHQQLVPPGAQGELWLGGAGLAREYLHRPELTAERFRPDPFRPGESIYRTGDVAAWGSDGRLRCLGRVDNQVKLRGHRIELGEIEAAIEAAPDVREAVVALREDRPGDQRLVAYVVGTAAGLIDSLRSRLPAYMVPSAVVELDAVPRTPNGKTDRAALPAPQHAATAGSAPTTAAEQRIAAVWTELLGVESPSVDDDFFALGGHSLLATRLAARLADAFGVRVELRWVFEHPVLGDLAAFLDSTAHPASPDTGPRPLDRTGRRLHADELSDPGAVALALAGKSSSDGELVLFPTSSTQQRMWLLQQIAPDEVKYHVPVLRRVLGRWDSDRLRAAIERLVLRHEVLRTTYHQVDAALVQVVHPRGTVDYAELDLTGRPADEALDAARTARDERFDLAAGPALRARLIRTAPDAGLLLLCTHHISLDGWSIGLLFDELAADYSGDEPLAAPLQLGDYAVWERHSDALEDDREYWSAQLAGAPAESTFPLSRPRSVGATPEGRRIRRRLDASLAGGIADLARRERATTHMVLSAAVSALLSRHGAGGDLVLGTPFSVRSFAGSERLVGPLINTLALRFAVDGAQSFAEHLRRTAAVCSDAYRHGGYPFDRLVGELDVERDPSRDPVFQILVTSGESRPAATSMGDAVLQPVEIDWQVSHSDMSFTLSGSADELDLLLEYRADLYDDQIVTWIVARFETLLAAAVADPSTPVEDLPVLAPDEIPVLDRLRGRALDAPSPLLTDRIAAAAATHPQRVAVDYRGSTLTFAELDDRAHGVAEVLRRHGVSPGDRVAVALGHCLEWPAAVLGCWAAGAVYVPVDPNYPPARQQFMLADADARVVLTDAETSVRFDQLSVEVVVVADVAPAPTAGTVPVERHRGAYLIYTSGSTGQPKGVLVSHDNLADYAHILEEEVYATLGAEVRRDTPLRVGVNSSTSFDLSMHGLVHLGYGMTVCPVPDDVRLDPPAMVAHLDRERIDVVEASVTHLRALAADGLFERVGGPRILFVGAEPFDQATWTALRDSGRVVFAGYGPTEVTIATVWHPVAHDTRLTLGTILPGVLTEILDAQGRLVPVGVPGEVWHGGTLVALGYLDRPELTSQRFFDRDGVRWYRTGDVMSWRADGHLDFVGRVDDQVKIRGYRVELGEVAAALRARPGVRDAVALAHDNELVAAVVVAPPAALDAAAMRHDLRAELPPFLVPTVIVGFDELPLTPSGKLDRQAVLAASTEVEHRAVTTFEPPEGPAEELIAELWAELLNVSQVGAGDNFFDLGGDSLSASRFVTQLRAMGFDLALLTVFEHPTVRALARPLTELLLGELGLDADGDD